MCNATWLKWFSIPFRNLICHTVALVSVYAVELRNLMPTRLGVPVRALRLGVDLILVSDIRAAIPGGQTGSKTLDPAEVRGYPSAIT
jgi:hypothetical protein